MKYTQDKHRFIASRIKEARQAAGMSQRELAEAIGFESATAISLIESAGRRVSVVDLINIAKTLQQDVDYFLTDKKNSVPDVRVALRKDGDISNSDKDAILHIIDLAKRKHSDVKRKRKT